MCCEGVGGSDPGARLDGVIEYDNLAKWLKSPGAPGRSSTLADGMAFQQRTSTRHGTIPNAETWQSSITTSMVRTT